CCPLFRCLCIPKPFAESVDEHETGYILGVGAGIKSDDQTAIRVPDKDIGPRLISGAQHGVQICNCILWGGRLWHRVAATWFLINRCSGTVAGVYQGELANLTEHRWRRFVCNAPILGGSPEA